VDPDRWRQIDDLFQAALDCEPAARAALLESVCQRDAELRAEVESLLEAHEHAGFTGLRHEFASMLEAHAAKAAAGRRIGVYRVEREIGQGGMGRVYLATRADDVFEKRVAIKVVRGLETADILARFRTERQILATLDHPNITRLLDGGTTDDGLPYFVMDFIEGEPIDRYCERRLLTVTERLVLFRRVLAAVQYAHQNLVIHRDIKPTNVLVTDAGVPCLLDFGIAKLLAPDRRGHDPTRTHLRPLTPEYASPEQVRGDPITTATDVYALGVLLYQLLSGRRPYRGATTSAAEVERAVCEEEPERPSSAAVRSDAEPGHEPSPPTPVAIAATREGTPERLRRRLAGDLDTIVMKALRKDPTRRYASVEQLAEDIRRHLDNLPVMARPDSRRYRVAKFIRRHRGLVAAATLVIMTLTIGLAATVWEAHRARQERDVARAERAKAASINAFLQDMVGYSAQTTSGSPKRATGHDATVVEMLDDAAQRVDRELLDQPEIRADLLNTIGTAYMILAKYRAAAQYLQEAYDLNSTLYGLAALPTATTMYARANLAYLTGDYAGAEAWFAKALPVFRQHAADPEFELHKLPSVLSDAAFVQRARGHLDQAEALWREALVYGPRLPEKYRGEAIAPKTFLAQLYLDRGDLPKADAFATEAVQGLRALANPFPLAQALIDLGGVRLSEGRLAEAESLVKEGTALYAKAQGPDAPNVSFGLAGLAMTYYRQGRFDLAEQNARAAMAIAEALPKGSHYYVRAATALGLVLTRAGRASQAEPLLREVLATLEATRPRQSYVVAMALGALGECLTAERRYAEAEPLLIESRDTLQSIQVPASPDLGLARHRLSSLQSSWKRLTPAARGRRF
jgi:eukaryotic-like serine/threonine-protein kinase